MSSDADYRAWVEVLPDFQNFNRTVENAVVGGMAGAGAAGGAAGGTALVAGIGKFAGPIAVAIIGLGIAGGITDAIKTGIDAGLSYLQTAVTGAADLEQSVGAVSAVFKDQAAQVEAWGGQAAESVGLSKNAYFEFATVVGAQLKNLGIPMDDVAGETDELINLGADLAAQFGGPTSDAVAALSSLLRGERDPIERYGVSMKEADVSARVLALGLSTATLEEERQAKILATLSLLNDQTADAQGAFARESETFLNVQQRTNAALEDMQTELGQELLPILTEVMVFVKDELVPLWQELNQEIGPELRAALEEAWPVIKDLAELILPLIPPAIEAIIGMLVWLAESFQVVATYTELVAGTFSDFFALLSGDMSIEEFVSRFLARVDAWTSALKTRVASAFGFFTDLGDDLLGWVGDVGDNLYRGGQQIIQQFINGIGSMFGAVGEKVGDLMDWVAGFFPHSPAKHGPLAGQNYLQFRDSGGSIVGMFADGLSDLDKIDIPILANLTGQFAAPITAASWTASEPRAAGSTSPTVVALDDTTIERIIRGVVDGVVNGVESRTELLIRAGLR